MSETQILIAALVSKLGGEVLISLDDMFKAEQLEIQRSEDPTFHGGLRLRVRQAPVTVEGEVVDDGPLMVTGTEAGITLTK